MKPPSLIPRNINSSSMFPDGVAVVRVWVLQAVVARVRPQRVAPRQHGAARAHRLHADVRRRRGGLWQQEHSYI